VYKKLMGLCCIFVVSANAGVVYDNGAGGPEGVDGGFHSDLGVPRIQADDMRLGASATVSAIQWTGWNFSSAPGADNFTLSIYADDGSGSVGGELASFAFGDAVNRTLSDVDRIYEYEALLSYTFDANVTYWISIVNDTTSDPLNLWAWSGLCYDGTRDIGPCYAGNSQIFPGLDGNWYTQGLHLDYRFIGVPTPGALSVFGVASLIVQRRRR